MRVYLDNAATTVVIPEVMAVMTEAFTEKFGNPAAMHTLGLEAEKLVKNAKENMASILHCDASEILITSGGTESINTVIKGVGHKDKPRRYLSTLTEHSAVYNSLMEMEASGSKVDFIENDENGLIKPDSLDSALNEKADLLTVIWVNNEVGTIQKINEIVRIVRKKQPECLIHVDATQAIGKLEIDLKALDIDFMSCSAHKIHGPKGVGILYKKKSVNLRPLILGGGQQNALRSGTENVPGTVGFAKALEIAYNNLSDKQSKLLQLKKTLIDGCMEIEDVKLHSPISSDFANHIVSMSFKGIKSEVLLHELASRGIYVSAGSACRSNSKNKGSRTLNSMKIPIDSQGSTIRMSLSSYNTQEEIIYAIENIKEAVVELRKYTKR